MLSMNERLMLEKDKNKATAGTLLSVVTKASTQLSILPSSLSLVYSRTRRAVQLGCQSHHVVSSYIEPSLLTAGGVCIQRCVSPYAIHSESLYYYGQCLYQIPISYARCARVCGVGRRRISRVSDRIVSLSISVQQHSTSLGPAWVG
jgi:hypothetical protein